MAIVGEAPTPAADVNTFRSCFGTQGTALKIHNAGQHQADPRELARRDGRLDGGAASSSRFDLWVHPISESDDDGDVEGFLAAARPAAAGDDQRHAAART